MMRAPLYTKWPVTELKSHLAFEFEGVLFVYRIEIELYVVMLIGKLYDERITTGNDLMKENLVFFKGEK